MQLSESEICRKNVLEMESNAAKNIKFSSSAMSEFHLGFSSVAKKIHKVAPVRADD